jgi:hypothetical protein
MIGGWGMTGGMTEPVAQIAPFHPEKRPEIACFSKACSARADKGQDGKREAPHLDVIKLISVENPRPVLTGINIQSQVSGS